MSASSVAGRMVVPRQHSKRSLEQHLGGARRPDAFGAPPSLALQEAAYVDQHPGQFRADRLERLVDPLPRRKRCVGQVGDTVGVAAGRMRRLPPCWRRGAA